MTDIAVVGAGAFGTALAVALAKDGNVVTLWARDKDQATQMQAARQNARYLPNISFPDRLTVTADPARLTDVATILLAVPTQNLRQFLVDNGGHIINQICVLCCKGIETGTGHLPSEILHDILPNVASAVLTGPGFAAEIASGKPTALTLAVAGGGARTLQALLSTETIRLYLSDDPKGAQLGGALKNVIAIACGISMGAGLGESARASLMTRGYAEILRLATDMGAKPATLVGLSGFGDMALTCTSTQSRNFTLGFRLGLGKVRQSGQTYEGVATAQAVVELAANRGIDMPIARMVASVLDRQLTVAEAMDGLLSRPLKQEN